MLRRIYNSQNGKIDRSICHAIVHLEAQIKGRIVRSTPPQTSEIHKLPSFKDLCDIAKSYPGHVRSCLDDLLKSGFQSDELNLLGVFAIQTGSEDETIDFARENTESRVWAQILSYIAKNTGKTDTKNSIIRDLEAAAVFPSRRSGDAEKNSHAVKNSVKALTDVYSGGNVTDVYVCLNRLSRITNIHNREKDEVLASFTREAIINFINENSDRSTLSLILNGDEKNCFLRESLWKCESAIPELADRCPGYAALWDAIKIQRGLRTGKPVFV